MTLRETSRLLTRTGVFCVLAAAGVVMALPARAETLNYVDLWRSKAIKCIHGTVNPEKATIEISKPAETAGEITTVRLKTFYEGLLKKNVMEADLMIRQAGSIRQMRIKILSDSGTSLGHCSMENTWTDF